MACFGVTSHGVGRNGEIDAENNMNNTYLDLQRGVLAGDPLGVVGASSQVTPSKVLVRSSSKATSTIHANDLPNAPAADRAYSA